MVDTRLLAAELGVWTIGVLWFILINYVVNKGNQNDSENISINYGCT